MDKRTFLTAGASAAVLLSTGCTTTGGAAGDPDARRRTINADVDNALSRLYREAAGSQELVARSAGVLVFPSVVSGGFIVAGSHGQGALRKSGKTAGYYTISAASVVISVPLILMVLLFQKRIVAGLTAGAVKG